ncbi:MAG: hypothetical protein EA380_01930 [Phycisphaeraceae bacterium]|nr:MAG: hypothetical protein EA380_01930 [Phycisphaeraceae bacterium]
MARGARVVSIELIGELRARLLAYREEAASILDNADSEVERAYRWVSQEQAAYWQSELRRREDVVVQARSDLARAEAQKEMGKPSTLDERRALERAKRAVEEAREKRQIVARWARTLDKEVQIYRGQTQPLRTHLEGPIERALTLLARFSQSLDDYVALSAPSQQSEGAASSGPAEGESVMSVGGADRARTADDWRRARPEFAAEQSSESPALLGRLATLLRGATAPVARHAASLGSGPFPMDQSMVDVAISEDPDDPLCLERVSASASDPQDSGWRIYSAVPRQDTLATGRVKVGELARSVSVFALLQAAPVGSLVVVQRQMVLAAFDPQGTELSRTIEKDTGATRAEDGA